MASTHLKDLACPKLEDATMLLALTGWMDGGEVSTGTVKRLMASRNLKTVATIDPDPFYIFNFPGSMEISALFRPEVRYFDGIVERFDMPSNIFHCDEQSNLVFFLGKEPNLRWQGFADCIFEVANAANVKQILFMGSFGGTVPHTREPRMFASVSHERLKPILEQNGCKFSDYEGPSGFATLLLAQCAKHGIDMMSIVAEIPGYLQGMNPLSIEAVTRRLCRILNLQVDFNAMRKESNEWELQVTQAVEKDEELAATVRKMEEQYDNELIGRAEE
jgi:proteasome assembly chaperone (PAC2) family protein